MNRILLIPSAFFAAMFFQTLPDTGKVAVLILGVPTVGLLFCIFLFLAHGANNIGKEFKESLNKPVKIGREPLYSKPRKP